MLWTLVGRLRAGTPVRQTPESAWQRSELLGEERPGLSQIARMGHEWPTAQGQSKSERSLGAQRTPCDRPVRQSLTRGVAGAPGDFDKKRPSGRFLSCCTLTLAETFCVAGGCPRPCRTLCGSHSPHLLDAPPLGSDNQECFQTLTRVSSGKKCSWLGTPALRMVGAEGTEVIRGDNGRGGGESQSGVGAAGGGQGQGDACCFKTHIYIYMGYSCIYINVCVR